MPPAAPPTMNDALYQALSGTQMVNAQNAQKAKTQQIMKKNGYGIAPPAPKSQSTRQMMGDPNS